MLGVDQRSDFRRASLVSEIYSETHGPTIGAAAGSSGAGGGSNGNAPSKPGEAPKKPLVRPPPIPPIPGMRRKIPKGKFGLIGLGKLIHDFVTCNFKNLIYPM